MASYGYTFQSGDGVTPTRLNDARTISDIVNADIKSDAAIAGSKLADNSVTSAKIADGTIVNADINASAAIAHSKLANITSGQVLLGNASNVPTATAVTGDVTISNTGVTAISSGVIVDADINASAAIALSKLATGALPTAITVASANIVDGTIVNADINASAAIADSKLATISTGGKVSNSATTATSANTANAIVARDASGNFSAGTITASLTGNVTGNLTGTASAIADGTVSTAKIVDGAVTQAKLASNVAGNGPIFRAEVSSATAVADNTWTKINVQIEVFDSNANFASSRFTPTVAGYYFINGSVDASGAAKVLTAGLYKNGTVRFATGDNHGDTTASWISNVSGTLYLNGTTDYVELWAYHNNGNSRNIGTDFNRTFLEGFLVRAA